MKTSPYIKILTILGVTIGFNFYGLSLFVLLLLIYWVIAIFDIFTRFCIERKLHSIKSSKFGNGILKRANKTVICLSTMVIIAHARYEFFSSPCDDGMCIFISAIPSIILGLFLAEELISLVENAMELDNSQNKVLGFIKKILGVGMRKGMEFTKNKIGGNIK
jgi:hypothetical protein